MKMKIEVNDHNEYELDELEGLITLNGEKAEFEIKKIDENLFLMLRNSKKYEIELISKNANDFSILIDGVLHKVSLIDRQKQILKLLGIEELEEDVIDSLYAPMPGSILEISCKVGDEVLKGDTLLILEAMKMENTIKSPANGTITEISVGVGENVEKDQILIVF